MGVFFLLRVIRPFSFFSKVLWGCKGANNSHNVWECYYFWELLALFAHITWFWKRLLFPTLIVQSHLYQKYQWFCVLRPHWISLEMWFCNSSRTCLLQKCKWCSRTFEVHQGIFSLCQTIMMANIHNLPKCPTVSTLTKEDILMHSRNDCSKQSTKSLKNRRSTFYQSLLPVRACVYNHKAWR